jgi:PhoPQ-activated pathogenicity-related protein
MLHSSKFVILALSVAFALAASSSHAREPLTGPLADYVNARDDSYQWFKRSEGQVLTCKYAELILTSQTWKDIVWKHQLFLLKPAQVDPSAKHALLMIAGGNWNEKIADPKTELKLPAEAQVLALVAESMKMPVAILLHVPQQPIFDGKREDQIISHTFREFLKSGDPTLPLLAPMTKSAVRAMDATQEALKKEWNLDVGTFTVTGASKRGWTTWLTGAVDDRAVAIAPMVINMLNMSEHTKLQRVAFGGQPSEQIDDYQGLDEYIDTPRGQLLRKIVDPFEYRERLTQPKLIILATNDRYWPLNAADLYWDKLEGEKHFVYVPNNGHGIQDRARLIGGLNALNRSVVKGQRLPKLRWNYANGGNHVELEVSSDVRPSRVQVWSAKADSLDFRDSRWTSSEARFVDDAFVHKHEAPAAGYAALLGEAVFNEGTDEQYWLSTSIRIVPSKAAADAGN